MDILKHSDILKCQSILKCLSTLMLPAMMLFSCGTDENALVPQIGDEDAGRRPILISGAINQEYKTRVNDAGFCDKDMVGIYIVDFQDGKPAPLINSGNRADNMMFTFDEKAFKWTPAYDIYWKDNHTHVDIYGYYPYSHPSDVSEYPFEVEKDQRRKAGYGKLSGYESSDFLWGKAADNSPTSSVIKLGFSHKMAGVRIRLSEGFGFGEKEWEEAQKQIIIHNTTLKSTIDLSTGEVSPQGETGNTGIIPMQNGDEYRAIVIPQTVPAGKSILSASIDGESYFLKKTEDIVYIPGKLHNFTIVVNKRSSQGDLEFILESESITVWENDSQSHDGVAKEYVIIDVKNAGTLEKCITESGKDIAQIRNLKLTGNIDAYDFAIMRSKMKKLSALNLKEVRIVERQVSKPLDNGVYSGTNEADEIPSACFAENKSLTKIILPDRLRKIGPNAFYVCEYLSGSLIIPEGVEEIGSQAFLRCRCLDGELYLPSTLKYIGNNNSIVGSTFAGCNFTCELKLPENLEFIGNYSFSGCRNLYGNLVLPPKMKYLGEYAFDCCSNLTGSLIIPQSITEIKDYTFRTCGFNGTLTLHDGIEKIGQHAFSGCKFRGELILPKNLEVINPGTFLNCDFSGTLNLPEGLQRIGDQAFSSNRRLSGILRIPKSVQNIAMWAFGQCSGIEGLVFEDGLTYLGAYSFYECYGLNSIVCKSVIPPAVGNAAFDAVPKDSFTIEVPESAVIQYKTATGWDSFKRISSYRNFYVMPHEATALNSSVTRSLVLSADEGWSVESMPEWVTLDKTSGKGKTELELTFSTMPHNSGNREGEIVFALEGKEYRTSCKVSQYDFMYEEDLFVPLQKATKGNGINIVVLGDGYDAQEISEGKLSDDLTEAYNHFFSIEPYRTYKDYFNVWYAVSVSPESGIGSVNTVINNKFNTTANGGVKLGGSNGSSDFNYIMEYITGAPGLSMQDLHKTLVIMVANSTDYEGVSYLWDNGFAISYCTKSDYGYPQDFRGIVQHEAGGHGFGKLGDEYIKHNTFIDACNCLCCSHVGEFNMARAKGWYKNLSLTGKLSDVPWSHLIFHKKYRNVVDIFEGGYLHSRGAFRSEQSSCMKNYIPYYNAISRESIVRRIKALAGEKFSFEEFVENDLMEICWTEDDGQAQAVASGGQKATKGLAGSDYFDGSMNFSGHQNPEFMGEISDIR